MYLGENRHWVPLREGALTADASEKMQLFDATIGSKNYTIWKNAREEYLSNGLRTTNQPLHHEQQWVLQ